MIRTLERGRPQPTIARRRRAWLPWIAMALAMGCGPSARRPPATSPGAPESGGVVRLELDDTHCLLRAQGGLVGAQCAQGTLTCTEVARADLAAAPGQEVVSRCDEPGDTHVGRALVVANGRDLLWVLPLDDRAFESDVKDCSLPPEVGVVVVDPVPGAHRELLIHKTQCFSPGLLSDSDSVWRFVGAQAEPIATATLECQFLGDTEDTDAPPPPPDEAWGCVGGYLEVAPVAGRWSVARLEADEMVIVGDSRGSSGRLAHEEALRRRALRWDPAASRFVDAGP